MADPGYRVKPAASIAAGDIDGDGKVESCGIPENGRGIIVYGNTGALKWVGSDVMGGAQYTGPISFAADIDQDGTLEVINGRSVYKADGSLKCVTAS